MKGYKVFNPDWTCRDYQFEVGKTFEEDVMPKCCNRGFHFCIKASDCFSYYGFDPNNKIAEVEAVGDIDTQTDDTKCSTNKLHIIREVSWQEVLELANLGKGCTGLDNSGDFNSGHYNSGNFNSGSDNSGDYNSGSTNSGNYNSSNYNSGDYNSGAFNSGNYNSGNANEGNENSGKGNNGDYNSGNYNSGYYNSGDYNSGNYNSGDFNSGDSNSGNYNSGDWNSGNYNSGNANSGDFNKASNVVGCFNTEQQKLKFFDKETDMTMKQWKNSEARYLMSQINFNTTEWISSSDMTDKEKAAHPEHKTTRGYLKICDTKNACIEWWNGLSKRDKDIIRGIPNFDAEKFYQITGIRA